MRGLCANVGSFSGLAVIVVTELVGTNDVSEMEV